MTKYVRPEISRHDGIEKHKEKEEEEEEDTEERT